MKCIGSTKIGKACRNHTLAGSELCYFHDPRSREQRRAAQSKGGSKRSHLKVMPPPSFDFDLGDARGIPRLLTFLANGVVRGELDTKVAYAVGYLADCAMRAHKTGELTERVEKMERLQQVENAIPISLSTGSSTQFEEDEDDKDGKTGS
jgi:hypothetical protein